MICKNCGDRMEGDGYALVFHCPSATLDCEEPDANPVYCLENERMTNQPNQYGITPGPWTFKDIHNGNEPQSEFPTKINVHAKRESGACVAIGCAYYDEYSSSLPREQSIANARAIAEVPAMIEAIENLAEFLDRYCPQSTGRDLYMNEARAILARIKDAS